MPHTLTTIVGQRCGETKREFDRCRTMPLDAHRSFGHASVSLHSVQAFGTNRWNDGRRQHDRTIPLGETSVYIRFMIRITLLETCFRPASCVPENSIVLMLIDQPRHEARLKMNSSDSGCRGPRRDTGACSPREG
jgi:hypothetical protein